MFNFLAHFHTYRREWLQELTSGCDIKCVCALRSIKCTSPYGRERTIFNKRQRVWKSYWACETKWFLLNVKSLLMSLSGRKRGSKWGMRKRHGFPCCCGMMKNWPQMKDIVLFSEPKPFKRDTVFRPWAILMQWGTDFTLIAANHFH